MAAPIALSGAPTPKSVRENKARPAGPSRLRASVIIAAGGTGSRFQKGLQKGRARSGSKLFFPLIGKPLLAHTIAGFQKMPQIIETLVAVPRGEMAAVKKMAQKFGWRRVRFIRGGKSRAESVRNALQKSSARTRWILVHDGARPFVARESVGRLFEAVQSGLDGALLARKVIPTLKEADPSGVIRRTVDRSSLFEAETPQLVKKSLLRRAYRENPKALEATDEASLLESVGASVKVVAHESFNPKITHVQDLEIAEAYLACRGDRPVAPTTNVRTGIGRDTHRLVAGRKFYLGSVRIPFEKGPLGHSDGDVLLHAVSDAILGAIGAGDIGDWFSDRNPRFKNMRSEKILMSVLAEARQRGWAVGHLDTIVILERPKLGKRKESIRDKVAKLLSLPSEAVSIKAKTAEGLGPEGEGLAVTCEAMVTVRRSAR